MKQWKGFTAGVLAALALSGAVGTAAATVGRQTVDVEYNDIDVTLDGVPVNLVDANGAPVEPFAINGTTYLPLRAVSGALGLEVGWDQETTTVKLTRPESQRTIYITRTGSKYHYDGSCNGGTYFPVPYETAVGFGLTPCEKCVLTEEN